jgi:hypothetical protein
LVPPYSAETVLCFTLILGSITLGGGIYETLLVDRVWIRNVSVIQPSRGGLDRKMFWGIFHPLFEVALLVSAWMNWSHISLRVWLIGALLGHFSVRVWSFAYFIPMAHRFEKLDTITPEDMRSAHQWVRLSRFRPILAALSLAALAFVLTQLASGSSRA